MPVERYADLGQEHFQVLTTEVLLCSISNSFKGLAARNTRLGVHTSERYVVVPRFEVTLLLLRQLQCKPVDDA